MFEILEHTGDIRLEVRSPRLGALYQDAVRGLMATLIPRESGDFNPVEHRIEVESADSTCLLVDFLNEVLWSGTSNSECYDQVDVISINERQLTAIIRGRTVEGFGEEIKAVTYHEADVRREGEMWKTNLVLDV